MESELQKFFERNLSVDLSIEIIEIKENKHLSGKEALLKTKYCDNGFSSISHSTKYAIGVSTPKIEKIQGIGIDFEEQRPLDIRASKMFLTKDEISILENPSSDHLLKLWTIKEAIFKSTPENNGLFLRNFEITEMLNDFGKAICPVKQDYKFEFASMRFSLGTISIATCYLNEV